MNTEFESSAPIFAAEHGSNVVLVGASGAGKSVVGVVLARLLGFGFIDLDKEIEGLAQKPAADIFAAEGEEHFRSLETQVVKRLAGLRSHVVATGGGAVMDDENWGLLSQLGAVVWLNTPPEEIARRLMSNEEELKRRPLLAEVLTHQDPETKLKLLTERINALIGFRAGRYRQAHLTVSDHFSTPQSTAQLVRAALTESGFLKSSTEVKPYDRWHIL